MRSFITFLQVCAFVFVGSVFLLWFLGILSNSAYYEHVPSQYANGPTKSLDSEYLKPFTDEEVIFSLNTGYPESSNFRLDLDFLTSKEGKGLLIKRYNLFSDDLRLESIEEKKVEI